MKHLSLFVKATGCLLLLLGAICSCQQQPHFTIKGNITGANDKTLYLEAIGIDRVTALDSTELGKAGTFNLKGKQPITPEFYRLRIDDKTINLTIDSTETVTVEADYADMPVNYTIEGSENNHKIKELACMQIDLQGQINKLYNDRTLTPFVLQDSITRMVDHYKEKVKRNYIFQAPNTMYAYFALFQRINNYLLFDPNSRDDLRCFGAVATSFEILYPHSTRTRNLVDLTQTGMRNTRAPQQKQLFIPEDKIVESGVIDIALRDQYGKEHRLTELKGKVVLLDFTIYQNTVSPARNMVLRELYDKYHSKGLEIYQISLDSDEHYWKTSADHLPWICVRDPNGIYSTTVILYNIQDLPTYFLINRDNELTMRNESIKDVETEIRKLL